MFLKYQGFSQQWTAMKSHILHLIFTFTMLDVQSWWYHYASTVVYHLLIKWIIGKYCWHLVNEPNPICINYWLFLTSNCKTDKSMLQIFYNTNKCNLIDLFNFGNYWAKKSRNSTNCYIENKPEQFNVQVCNWKSTSVHIQNIFFNCYV